jgi:hypothetical protein
MTRGTATYGEEPDGVDSLPIEITVPHDDGLMGE